MENLDVPIFEDPALKASLRRHYSCSECCPNHLRNRVAAMLGEAASPPTTSTRWWRSYGPSLAIAATMFIAIGVVTVMLTHSANALPARLQAAACLRHDSCCKHASHATKEIPQTFPAVGQYLRSQLNHPVLAANFTKDQWKFRGAAICPVDGTPSAHLLFEKGSRTLSVFSLPSSAFPLLKNNQTYEGSTEGHSVVATRKGDAVYCLVCYDPSGSVTTSSLREMLQEHENEAAVAAVPMNPSRNLHLALSIGHEN